MFSLRRSLVVVAGIFIGIALASGQTETAGTQPAQWRMVWKGDPATQALVAWNTRESGQSHLVRFRSKSDGAAAFEERAATKSGEYSYRRQDELPLFYHYVELEQLQPATEYELEMVSDGHVSPRFYFRTAPDGAADFSLLFGSDSRSDHPQRRMMNRLLARLVEEGARSGTGADDILALMHGGDYVFGGTNLTQWSQWMSDHELTTTSDGRLLPIIPARGNHDRGRLFCEVFGFDARDNHNWYAISFGERLRVVTLNTEASVAGNQADWLRQQLAAARPVHTWLVAQYHQPAYPAVKWPSSALNHWVPLFEKYDVDLVCEADGHDIKRTLPIRGGKFAEDGVVYIGEGGLGVPQRTPKSDRWFLQSPGMSGSGHHVQRLRFTADAMTYECVLQEGEICDRWERLRRESAVMAQATSGS